MKTIKLLVAAGVAVLFAFAGRTETYNDGTYTWTYKATATTLGYGGVTISSVSPKPSGAVTIPAQLGGENVTVLGNCLFMNKEGITAVTIPSTVKYIGYETFQNCKGLSEIALPSGLERIGPYAFYGLDLESIEIPGSVTEINAHAFCHCHNLTTVTLHEGLVSIGDGAFGSCAKLANCTLPSTVRQIDDYAFGATALTSVDLPEGMKVIGRRSFLDCGQLTSVTIPSTVTNIEHNAFCDTALESVTLPDGLTILGEAAFSGTQIETVTIPAGVREIGSTAFRSCKNLVSVTLPPNLLSIGSGAFDKCVSLPAIDIPNGVTNIGYSAFYGCKSLTAVTLPDSVKKLGHYAFLGCDNLESIDFGDGLEDIEYETCYNCPALRSVKLPCGLKTIGTSAFNNALATQSELDIPASVYEIGDQAFASARLSVRFFGSEPANTSDMNYCIFRYGYKNVTLYLPDNNSSWAAALAAGTWQKATVKPLSEHPDSHTNFTFEARDAYSYKVTGISGTLQEGAVLVIPSEYNGKPVACIGDSAFKDKNRVSAIVLPDTITEIRGYAFSGLGITSIAFPASLETLYATALDGCSNLRTVTFAGKRPPSMPDSFYEDSPWELTTYVRWETDYDNWSLAVAGGTWCSRKVEWWKPIEEALAEGVAVFDDEAETLTFSCDGKDHSSEGKVYFLCTNEARDPSTVPEWYAIRASVKKVVFDSSMATHKAKHCAHWFRDFTTLASVTGLEYLDVSAATSLAGMFENCSSLGTLDLTGFNTAAATSMEDMFSGSSSLETIRVSTNFVTTGISSAERMFDGCTSLAGGTGFEYDASKINADYAKINTVAVEGYFTGQPKAVAVYDEGILTFYCDSVDRVSNPPDRWVYDLADAEKGGTMPWADWATYTYTVVFDESFAAYKPKSCANWFAGCDGLKTIRGIRNLDVGLATDLSGMFSGCTSLVTLDLAYFNTGCVTNMTDMFNGCSSLVTIYAGVNFRTDALASTAQTVFSGCEALVSGKGLAYDSSKVSAEYARIDYGSENGYFTDGSSAGRPVAVYDSTANTVTFYCDAEDHEDEGTVYSLALCTGVAVNPPWSGESWRSSVARVVFDESFADYRPRYCYRWFNGFGALTEIDGLENLNVSEATTLRQMFASCSSLTSLDLSMFNTRSATTMENMFYKCSSLVTIYVSSTFVTNALAAPTESVFEGCAALTGGYGTTYAAKAAVSKSDAKKASYACIDRVGTPGYFTEKGLAAVAVKSADGKSLAFYYDTANHSADGTVYQVADAEATDPVTGAPPWAGACGEVEIVVFTSSFANYKPKHCCRWFNGFEKLTTVTGHSCLDLSQATSVARMFAGCLSLQNLYLDGVDTSSVTTFKAMFSGCTQLSYVNLDELDVSSATDLSEMFYGCSALKSLDLYSFDTAKVKTMSGMFWGCSALEKITVSDEFVTTAVTDKTESPFYNNTVLTGGAGTAFDAGKVSVAYAKIDGGEGDEGYFTRGFVARAVLSSDAKTLTFFFDAEDHTPYANAWLVADAEAQDPSADAPWKDACAATVTRVVFDGSFADYHPRHCGSWFAYFRNVEEFVGLENLDVSRATSLRLMFWTCDRVKTLDLSTWNTPELRDMAYMFKGANLEEIDVSSNFNALDVDPSQVVFLGCPKLCGELGTKWDSSRTTAQFARVDVEGVPGLLSRKLRALAVQYGATLTFYYDREEHPQLDGSVYSVAEAEELDPSELMPWDATRASVGEIVIDPSFADYRPKHCGNWFRNFNATLTGLDYLDVSEATSLQGMFYGFECETLDLGNFDTANVTNMTDMIGDANRLVTVYVSEKFVTTALVGAPQQMFLHCSRLTGRAGTTVGDYSTCNTTYARVDDPDNDKPGYFTPEASSPGAKTKSLIKSGYVSWAAGNGFTGSDAAWDAKPGLWNGEWENAFIFTYGEGLVDGTTPLMEISFDGSGNPVITTPPVVDGHTIFSPEVIGAENVGDWATPVELENASGNDWTLPVGEEANFFRVRMSN